MWYTLSSAWPLLLGLHLLLLGHGLLIVIVMLRASALGFSALELAIVSTSYFVGYFLGSISAPKMVERTGHVRVFAALASLASTSALVHLVTDIPVLWMLARILCGFCMAGIYVVAESWLNNATSNDDRAQVLGIYLLVNVGSIGIGQFISQFDSSLSFTLYLIVSILISIGMLPMLLTADRTPVFEAPQPVSIKRLFQISPLATLLIFLSGVLFGGGYGLAVVYAKSVGFTDSQAGIFSAITFLGGLVFQWPLGYLSDKFDRRSVILAVSAGAVLFAFIGTIDNLGFFGICAVVFLLNAFMLPLYSMGISHANDYLDGSQIVSAGAALILVSGVGGIIGSPVFSLAMYYMGPNGYFYGFAFILSVVFAYTAWRMTQRSALEEQTGYVPMTTTQSTVSTNLNPDSDPLTETVMVFEEAQDQEFDTIEDTQIERS